jgi:hypothetical protein
MIRLPLDFWTFTGRYVSFALHTEISTLLQWFYCVGNAVLVAAYLWRYILKAVYCYSDFILLAMLYWLLHIFVATYWTRCIVAVILLCWPCCTGCCVSLTLHTESSTLLQWFYCVSNAVLVAAYLWRYILKAVHCYSDFIVLAMLYCFLLLKVKSWWQNLINYKLQNLSCSSRTKTLKQIWQLN